MIVWSREPWMLALPALSFQYGSWLCQLWELCSVPQLQGQRSMLLSLSNLLHAVLKPHKCSIQDLPIESDHLYHQHEPGS